METAFPSDPYFAGMPILIKGAGDLASGVAVRLHNAGWPVIMTELAQPLAVRCGVSFSQAVYNGHCCVEHVKAELASDMYQASRITASGRVAVIVADAFTVAQQLQPAALVEATLQKRNNGLNQSYADCVIALGPGFIAGVDCHAVIETLRGHDLGRVIYSGPASPNTGLPGFIGGYGETRVLRSPSAGVLMRKCDIGDTVLVGDVVALVDGVPLCASLNGVVRGLLPSGTMVQPGQKSGDIDPRGVRDYCFTVSDKARAVAGGVIEALLHFCVYPER